MSGLERKDGNDEPIAGRGRTTDPKLPTADPKPPVAVLFRMPVELRWRDLDAFNHVNNANFLTFIEEARIRWFDSLRGPWVTDSYAPLLAAVQINYRQPIAYPSNVSVELFAERVGNSSLTLGHRILNEDGDALYADGHSVLVWIDRAGGRPIALPEIIRAAATSPRI